MAIESAGSVARPPQTYEGAMLKKIDDHIRQQGEAALTLLDAAKAPPPPRGTGSLVNDTA